MDNQKIAFEIQSALKKIEGFKDKIKEYTRQRGLLKFSGHQVEAYVEVCGVRLQVSTMDNHYMQAVRPGCNMIVLGMQKFFNGMIWDAEDQIKKLEQRIAVLTSQIKIGE